MRLSKPVVRSTAVILMFITPVMWSIGGVVIRQIQRATPLEQVFWRSLFAGFFAAAAIAFLQRAAPWRVALAAGWGGAFSAVMWATMFTAFIISLSFTTTANALVLTSISPLVTALLARAVLGERVPARTLVAAAIAALGIAWMFKDGLSAQHVAGLMFALVVPLAAAANVVTMRAHAARPDMVAGVMLGAFLSCLVAFVLAPPFAATARDLALLALLGVVQLGLPCMLLVIASRTLPGPEILLLGLLEVVLGTLWAWLGADENPGAATLAGGAIVLAALAGNELAALRTARRSATPA
jgi:drug/metabolite transporter (DMT)-like permease